MFFEAFPLAQWVEARLEVSYYSSAALHAGLIGLLLGSSSRGSWRGFVDRKPSCRLLRNFGRKHFLHFTKSPPGLVYLNAIVTVRYS